MWRGHEPGSTAPHSPVNQTGFHRTRALQRRPPMLILFAGIAACRRCIPAVDGTVVSVRSVSQQILLPYMEHGHELEGLYTTSVPHSGSRWLAINIDPTRDVTKRGLVIRVFDNNSVIIGKRVAVHGWL